MIAAQDALVDPSRNFKVSPHHRLTSMLAAQVANPNLFISPSAGTCMEFTVCPSASTSSAQLQNSSPIHILFHYTALLQHLMPP